MSAPETPQPAVSTTPSIINRVVSWRSTSAS